MDYDIFNGDADGICSLHQLRLADPRPDARLITGVKRDIKLLAQLQGVTDSRLTILDISLESNRAFLEPLLGAGNQVSYIDHHFAGLIPQADNLTSHIDPDPAVCASLIVNSLLENRYPKWAVVGAFGDNLHDSATNLAQSLSLNPTEQDQLQKLGELLNYNGYGADLTDLHFHPADLYRAVQPFEDPFDFLASSPDLKKLSQGFERDMEQALTVAETLSDGRNRVYHFPNASWARRIVVPFSNLKAREQKDIAHALIVDNSDKSLRISVRAPLNNRKNADVLCLKFPTGGGRAAAAGINNLPPEMLDDFLRRFQEIF